MMQHQFVFTPEDVYKTILAIAGFIVAVTAALKVILEAIKKAKEPDQIQNGRITSLEERVTSMEDKMKRSDENLERVALGSEIIMKCLLAMMSHELDGNHTEGLRQAQEELNDFLIKGGLRLKN